MKLKLFALRLSCPVFLLALLTGSAALTIPVSAQQSDIITSPKILVVHREYTKPHRDGASHVKTESAFIQQLAAGKSNLRYFAETSLTGPPRTLFMSSFPSFANWESEMKAANMNPSVTAALDRANVADGDNLSSNDISVWVRRDDLSLNPGWRVGARYEEIEMFTIRPGHEHQWEELGKMILAGYKKGVPDAHWGAYEEAFGTPGGGFLIISTHKSAAEIDHEFASDKDFMDAMGEDGMKKMGELLAECVESHASNLFMIEPSMSYPPEQLIASEPDFWKSQAKTMAKPMAKKAAQ